ncbi:MAG: molecular chaperone DnaJ [Clostridia bacterium]|nr:molecular chaperone DnaJ [Clostridia bacterium]
MRDPYEVLGLSPGSSVAQVKKTYKELARQASELPQEQYNLRMEELNEAYDSIINTTVSGAYDAGRGNAYDSAGRSSSGYGANNAYSNPSFDDIRQYINAGRYDEADMLLNGTPASSQTAEWHFLKGQVLYHRGWLENASTEFEAAYRMEPQNQEYKNAYESVFQKRSGGYRSTGGTRRNNDGCDACNICSGLLCADCCCESLGGDLIPCC